MAQQQLQFTFLIGDYMNDHGKREFHATEREWKLAKGMLSYSIDVHDVRYADTLQLTSMDVDSLRWVIVNGKLDQNQKQWTDSKHLDKWEVSKEIRLDVTLQGKVTHLDLRGKGYSALENEPLALAAEELEQLLYRIIDRHR